MRKQQFIKHRWLCRFCLAIAIQLLAGTAFAQVKISGRVTNEKGEPISGVSFIIRKTTSGSFTDADGDYSLSVNLKQGNYIASFSGVGYKSNTKSFSVTANLTYTLDAVLSTDLLGLDEVVVTGTTVATSKRRLGNAISTVSAKDIQNSGAASIDGALQGKVVGAQINQNSGNPAGGISVTLRGVSTITGSSEPLYLLDGVILNNANNKLFDIGGGSQNRLVDINPNDIDHIEVIKGASAAAIYGSRASNGVVQIFTKRGKEGKPTIAFSTSIRTSSLRKKLPFNEVPFAFNDRASLTDKSTFPVTRYDYQDKIFQKAMGTENSLSLSGGSAGTKYYLSLSNFYNESIIKNSDFNRNGIKLNIDQKVNKYININAGLNYVISNSKEVPTGYVTGSSGVINGFIFADNYINPDKDPVTGIYPNTSLAGAGPNPLEVIEKYNYRQRTNRVTGNLGIKIKPVAGLSIDYNFGIDNYTQLGTAFVPLDAITQPDFAKGLARRADATVTQLNNDFSATYKMKLLEWLQSTTTVGGTIQYDKTSSSAIQSDASPFGQVVTLGTSTAVGDFRAERSFWGQFIQQSFDIDNKLFITGALRSDASSIFGTENRRQLYPKVSGSYVLSNEKFWEKSVFSKVVSSIKLRAAWGRSGNISGIGTFDRFSNYNATNYNGNAGYLQGTTLGNESIRPEQQTEFEIGTDIGLLKDRLSVEFNYYKKDVKDLLLNVTLPFGTGYAKQLQNTGNLNNKGIELLVKGIPIQTNNLTWVSTFSISTNSNKVSGIEVLTNSKGVQSGGFIIPGEGFGIPAAVNGYALGAFYTKFYARNPDGSFLLTAQGFPQREAGLQGANGEYIVKRDPITGQPLSSGTDPVTGQAYGLLNKVIGNPLPKQLMSFINEVNYKAFTFRFQFDGAFGFNVFNFNRRAAISSVIGGGSKEYEKELRGEVPKGYGDRVFRVFEEFIEKGDYIKLREISLGYNWKPKVKWVQNVRFNLSGRNLLSFDKYSGYDPETNSAGQSNVTRAFDSGEVPIPRSFNFGINVNF